MRQTGWQLNQSNGGCIWLRLLSWFTPPATIWTTYSVLNGALLAGKILEVGGFGFLLEHPVFSSIVSPKLISNAGAKRTGAL